MNKPHWEKLHTYRMDDFRFILSQIYAFKLLLRKHPSDVLGDRFRGVIANLKKCLALEVSAYEDIYGDKPNIRKLREEVEQ